MANLTRRVALWQEANLITEQQARAILAFEAGKGANRFVLAILAVGAFCVALGFLAIVAANWSAIPAPLKLIIFFLLWIGIGFSAWHGHHSNKPLLRETALTVFSLMMFAGIGLVAQMSHLSMKFWHPFAFWSAAMCPIILTMRSRFLPPTWMLTATASVFLFITSSGIELRTITKTHAVLAGATLGLWSLALPFYNKENWATHETRSTWRHLGFTFLILAPALGGQMSWLAAKGMQGTLAAATLIAAAFFMVSAVLLVLSKKPDSKSSAWIPAVAAATSLICVLKGDASSRFAGAIFFIIPFAVAAYHATKTENHRLFSICTAIIGLRLLFVYFEVLGSLAITGTGLIVSGLLLIGAVYIWRRAVQKFMAFGRL